MQGWTGAGGACAQTGIEKRSVAVLAFESAAAVRRVGYWRAI